MIIVCRGVRFRWSLRKFIINILICLIILAIAVLYLTNTVKATPDTKIKILTIQPGETLWSIARRIAPEKDPRDVIDLIKKDNNLQFSGLTIGQTIKLVNFD